MAKKKKNTTSWKKVLGIVAGVLAVLAVVFLFVYNRMGDNGTFGRYTYPVTSENHKVSNNMMNYFLTTTYQQYYSSYSYYINQGTDTASDGSSSTSAPTLKELKDKQCSLQASDADVKTWYDYFLLEITVPQVKNMLVLAEAADAAGYKLTEEDEAKIDEVLETYKTTAQSYGYSSGNEFMMFGAGIKEKDVRAALELSQLASSYSQNVSDSFTYDDANYDAYLEEHKDEFRYVDYLSFTLKGDDLVPKETEDAEAADDAAADADTDTETDAEAATDTETVTETEAVTETETEAATEAETDADTEADTDADTDAAADDADTTEEDAAKAEYYEMAKEGADKIAAAASEDEFRTAVEDYLREVLYKDLDDAEKDEKVKTDLEAITVQSKVYADDEVTGKLFESEAGKTVLDDTSAESGTYTVYFVTAADHIEEYATKNAYAIIIEAEEEETADGQTVQVTDRAVEDGDTVNIDYVGTVDGVEFEGGNTNGQGTNVTAGGTDYIDDFLTQIIGHMPGETFDVNVTFPDPYTSNEELSGKDAVFKTTINYISETPKPEDKSLETVKTVEDALAADSSAENFAKLAKEYSAGATDAVYENVTKTYFDSEELTDWLYDDARVAGDRSKFDITASESGEEHVHHVIIQYTGDGLVKWKYDADNKLRQEDLTAKSEEFEATYGGDKITVDKVKLYKMS